MGCDSEIGQGKWNSMLWKFIYWFWKKGASALGHVFGVCRFDI